MQAPADTAEAPPAVQAAPVAHPLAAPHDTLGTVPTAIPAPVSVAPLSSAAMPAPTIAVESVSAPSIESLGTLDEKNGGLSATLWKNSTRDSAYPLLLWMHAGVSNPTMRDLTERALLTNATAPAGSNADWFVARVQTLIAMGDDDKAEQLIGTIPASMVSEPLDQQRAQLLLLRGDSGGACKLSDKYVGNAATTNNPILWQKMNVFCKAIGGHTDEASVALDLMRESHGGDDAFLQDIVHKFADRKYEVKASPAHWTLLDVAILRLGGESDNLKEHLDVIPPISLKYLAADATLDPKLRDKIQNRAIQLGMLPFKDTKPSQLQNFARNLQADVTTLVNSLGAGTTATLEADNAVIARLAIDDSAATIDCRRVQRLLSLIEPFGYRITPDTWNKLFYRRNRFDGEAPPVILIDRLHAAAQAGNKGEVILLSALIINSADVDKLGELILQPVVKALNTVGFTNEARMIAHDAVQSYITH